MLKDANLAASGFQLCQRSHLTLDASSAVDIYDCNLYKPPSTRPCRGLSSDVEKKVKNKTNKKSQAGLCEYGATLMRRRERG